MRNFPVAKLRLTLADVILLCTVPVVLLFLYQVRWQQMERARHSGDARVVIYKGTTKMAEYPLHHDRTIRVRGKTGHSHIEIRAGRARFTKSSCTSKYCIYSGWQQYAGRFTACQPNRIGFEILGTARPGREPRFDAINF